MVKDWWKSRTLWVNTVALVGVICVGKLHWFDTGQWAELTTMFLAIINLFLRLDTTTAVGTEGK